MITAAAPLCVGELLLGDVRLQQLRSRIKDAPMTFILTMPLVICDVLVQVEHN
jgi:hypothetical protein